MSTAPRFLIAKYVEDVRRMEPRNIGVILWAGGHVEARFLGEGDPGTIVKKPAFIGQKNLPVYTDWVSYWRAQMEKGALQLEGNHVPKHDPGFLDALRKKCRENYLLVDAGLVPAPIEPQELKGAVVQLYEELVADGLMEKEDAPSVVLDQTSRQFFEQTGLRRHPNFHENYEVKFAFRSIERPFHFSYGIGPGGHVGLGIGPEAVFQKTLIRNEKDVSSTLFLMESVTRPKHGILPKRRCASLVHATPADKAESSISSALDMLATVGVVVNVAEPDQMQAAFHDMGVTLNGNGHH